MKDSTRPLVVVVDSRPGVRSIIVEVCKRHLRDRYRFIHALGLDRVEALARQAEVAAILMCHDGCPPGPDDDAPAFGGEAAPPLPRVLGTLRATCPAASLVVVTNGHDPAAGAPATQLGAEFLDWHELLADPDLLAGRMLGEIAAP